MTSSTLWTPSSFSRFSRSKMKPWFSQTLAAISGSIGWLGAGKTLILIRSAMMLNGLRPRRAARSVTMIGGLMMMSFGSSDLVIVGFDWRRGGGELPVRGGGRLREPWRSRSSSLSRILEMVPSTALPVRVVLRTLDFLSSANRSSAFAFCSSSSLGAGGTTSASLRWRSRREGFLVVSSRSRTLVFQGSCRCFRASGLSAEFVEG